MAIRSIPVFDQLQRLIIVRHGEAQVHAASDHERALTLGGERSLDRTKELLEITIKKSQLNDFLASEVQLRKLLREDSWILGGVLFTALLGGILYAKFFSNMINSK